MDENEDEKWINVNHSWLDPMINDQKNISEIIVCMTKVMCQFLVTSATI